MSIEVKTITGQSFRVVITPKSQGFHVTAAVNKLSNIPVGQMSLIYRGQPVYPDFFLSDYGIVDGATLHLTLRLGTNPQLRHFVQKFRFSHGTGEVMTWTNEDYRESKANGADAPGFYIPTLVIGTPRLVVFPVPHENAYTRFLEPSDWTEHIAVIRTPKGGNPGPVDFSVSTIATDDGVDSERFVVLTFPGIEASAVAHPCSSECYDYRVILNAKGEMKCNNKLTGREYPITDLVICNFTVKPDSENCAACEEPLYGHLFTCAVCEEQLHVRCYEGEHEHVCQGPRA